MDATEICVARDALRKREGIPESHSNYIGMWSTGEPTPKLIFGLPEWARARGVEDVVWTALPPKFDMKEQEPTIEQVIQYLAGLTGSMRDAAERYIRFTPRQIYTMYRRRIEVALQWIPAEPSL